MDLVCEHVAAVLGHAPDSAPDPGRGFRELGFDSLTSVDLGRRLSAATGLRLSSTLVFDYPTPVGLAGHLLTELLASETVAAAPVPVAAPGAAGDDPIVIVGMGCRFPGGVSSPDDLWELVTEGREGLSAFPANRGWDLDALPPRESGFLHDAGEFDAGFFGISPREALAMDAQQRVLLETSWEAVESAGIDPATLRGSRTGVFAGVGYHDYAAGVEFPPESLGFIGTGTSASVISGRVAYTLGLEGPGGHRGHGVLLLARRAALGLAGAALRRVLARAGRRRHGDGDPGRVRVLGRPGRARPRRPLQGVRRRRRRHDLVRGRRHGAAGAPVRRDPQRAPRSSPSCGAPRSTPTARPTASPRRTARRSSA